jgi:hypothetical protein
MCRMRGKESFYYQKDNLNPRKQTIQMGYVLMATMVMLFF